uniref:Uncharacterized protein n=1 Tax=Arundo donax TaxID=35708 RepID=A0A0A8Y1A0_ARUDO
MSREERLSEEGEWTSGEWILRNRGSVGVHRLVGSENWMGKSLF